ncbi:hypothetical protein FISHEDRAFT_29538, partial [Fistulina hepatica ATCC 64428]
FSKYSRGNDVRLNLTGQPPGQSIPEYGQGAAVEGTVELLQPSNVTSVEVHVLGRLKLKEIAEGGRTEATLIREMALLWFRDARDDSSMCPAFLEFCVRLPTSFIHGQTSYSLPPSYSARLEGVPGFTASVNYSISAVVQKTSAVASLVPLFSLGATTISTPFTYRPRSRPSEPPPPRLLQGPAGVHDAPGWRCYQSVLVSKSPGNLQNIDVRFYLPGTRIFCLRQAIPYHLVLCSSSTSLAVFLPSAPTTPTRQRHTRVQLIRQTSVGVAPMSVGGSASGSACTSMWRCDAIGEGSFKHAGDGQTWMAFSGELIVDSSVTLAGFHAAGLSVKDCVVLTIRPLDNRAKPLFSDIRQVMPVRLTTDPYVRTG